MPSNPKPPDLADLRARGELEAHPAEAFDQATPMPDPAAFKAEEKRKADAAKAAAELDKLRVGTFTGEAFAQFERRRDGLDRPVPLPPHWTRTALELRGGLWAGCYVLVGGTGAGKSQWAFEVAYHAVTRPDPVPVLYVGLELDRAGVVARLAALGMHGRVAKKVPWSGLYLGEREPLEAMDGYAGREVREGLDKAPFYLMSGEALGGWSYDELRPAVERLRARHPTGPALVIVDFLQLVGSADPHEETRERIGKAAYEARMVARAHGVSVLLLSATARSYYPLFSGAGKSDGGDVSPLGSGDTSRFLGTGKESGEVEYAADGVIALCREKREPTTILNPNPPPASLWLAVAKSRTGWAPGANGWAELRFDGTSFTEAAARGSGGTFKV